MLNSHISNLLFIVLSLSSFSFIICIMNFCVTMYTVTCSSLFSSHLKKEKKRKTVEKKEIRNNDIKIKRIKCFRLSNNNFIDKIILCLSLKSIRFILFWRISAKPNTHEHTHTPLLIAFQYFSVHFHFVSIIDSACVLFSISNLLIFGKPVFNELINLISSLFSFFSISFIFPRYPAIQAIE